MAVPSDTPSAFGPGADLAPVETAERLVESCEDPAENLGNALELRSDLPDERTGDGLLARDDLVPAFCLVTAEVDHK